MARRSPARRRDSATCREEFFGPHLPARSAAPAGSSWTAKDCRTRLWQPRSWGSSWAAELVLDAVHGLMLALHDQRLFLGPEMASKNPGDERGDDCDEGSHQLFSLQVKRG